jgi:hypothetical protein
MMTLSTGAVVRAEMVRGPDGYQLNILSGNSPEAMKQFRDDMNHLTETKSVDWSVNLDFYQYAYDRVSAHVGWLREAYLVAFAVFGYRYILDPALEPVRQQLARPREQLISTFKVEDRKHGADLRLFSVINEPDWLRSVAIQFGHRTVFLPQLGDPDLYRRLDDRRQTASGIGWPSLGRLAEPPTAPDGLPTRAPDVHRQTSSPGSINIRALGFRFCTFGKATNPATICNLVGAVPAPDRSSLQPQTAAKRAQRMDSFLGW